MTERYLIVVARFNDMVTRALLDAARETFLESGCDLEHIDVLWVPGCFELPVVCANAARGGRYQAIVSLGAVIRGDTPHFDYVAAQAASGLMNVSVTTGVPVIFGVLTTDTVEQALNRAGLKHGNKGADAVRTAIAMTKALKQLEQWRQKR